MLAPTVDESVTTVIPGANNLRVGVGVVMVHKLMGIVLYWVWLTVLDSEAV